MSFEPNRDPQGLKTEPISRKRELLFGILLLLVSCLLGLILLEIAVRIISPPSPFHPLIPLRPKMKMEIHIDLPGVSPVSTHSTNRWGLRGDEPPAEWEKHYTIVAIGGSTTHCFYLDDHKAWPYLLQEKLKKFDSLVWVGNGGVEGHSTRAHIIFMEKVIPKMKPDAVIFLIGGSDLGFSISKEQFEKGNPQDIARGHSFYWPLFYSRLVQLLSLWKQILVDKVEVVGKEQAKHNTFEQISLDHEFILPDKSPGELLPALGEYRKNIKKLIALSRAQRVRPIFLTHPLLFDDTEQWKHILGEYYWIKDPEHRISAATYWRLLNIYNQELLDVCREEKVECFDLGRELPHSSDFFYDSVHLNERGAEEVANRVAAFLLSRGLPEKPIQ